ncbi:UNVERIFIED_CONTAM: hypothetical protein RMT77_000017 [Armadillidium vulgare]
MLKGKNVSKTIIILNIFILSFICKSVGCIECFVCSYSPRGNSSRMDVCTDANFTDSVIDARTCDVGCEAVSVYDKNGNLESFHRNCYHTSASIVNECLTSNNVLVTRTVCSCDWNYCNASHRQEPFTYLVLSLVLVLQIISHVLRKEFSMHGT